MTYCNINIASNTIDNIAIDGIDKDSITKVIYNKERQSTLIVQKVLKQWNDFAKEHGLMTMKSLSQTRYRKFKLRVKEGMDFNKTLDCIKQQKFLLGKSAPAPGASRPWKITFDWLVRNDTNWIKVNEMYYADPKDNKRERLL